MTRQEEVREILELWADDTCLFFDGDCKYRGKDQFTHKIFCKSSNGSYGCLMKALHSQGVVLKVERELPFVTSNFVLSEHGVYVKVINEALTEQGYVAVEPLINR